MSLSKDDVIRIKDRILESIGENAKIIRNSKEETLYNYCIDFFALTRQSNLLSQQAQ